MVSIPVPISTLGKIPSPFQRTVLQVENNPANADLITELVARRSDLKLLTAVNARLGIEMANAFQPDIILMDMRMPDMNGFDALLVLRNSAATSHIPVTILSSNAALGEDQKCLDAGAFGYLTKPYRIETLMEAMESALRHAMENPPAA